MTFYIHVEPTRLRADQPALVLKDHREAQPMYVERIVIEGPSVLVQDAKHPLPDGTRAWIETEGPVKIGGRTGR